MGFKKKKIQSKRLDLQKLIELQKIYQKDLKRNYIIGNILGVIAVILIFIVAVGVFIKLPQIDLGTMIMKNIAGNISSDYEEDKHDTKTILIVGRGGELNDAPNLTDTIILARVDSENKYVTMLSIPRDLYVKYPNSNNTGKINAIFQNALAKNGGDEASAMESLEGKIEEITGETIDNYILIDFRGFISIVDSVGGVDINVPETLIDNEYPDFNWGYQTLKVEKGLQHMDGSLALKYARSRHSTNDFDRSLRQQLVIQAIKEKVTSLGYLANPFKVKSLYLALKQNINTDLGLTEMISLALLAKQVEKSNIFSFNLNDSCFYGADACQRGGFLYTPPRDQFGGASVVIPNTATSKKLSDYTDILRFSNVIFNYPQVFKDNIEINVFNSTKISGLASIWRDFLMKYGFNIPEKDSIGNTAGVKYETTTILYNNIADDDKTIEALKLFFLQTEFRKVEKPVYSTNPNTKIEIIIGKDYKSYKMY